MKLHRCPPLNAWISVRQCENNAETLRAGGSAGSLAWQRGIRLRDACEGCPGVLRLRAGTRELGDELLVSRGTHSADNAAAARAAAARRPRGKPDTTSGGRTVRVQHRTASKRVVHANLLLRKLGRRN